MWYKKEHVMWKMEEQPYVQKRNNVMWKSEEKRNVEHGRTT